MAVLEPRSIGGMSVFVASAYSSAAIKARADYVCDGVDDEVEINQAIADIPASGNGRGGKIELSGGIFNISNPILINKHGVTLEGAGVGDKPTSATPSTGTMIVITSGATGLDNSYAIRVGPVGTSPSARPSYGVRLINFSINGEGRGTNVSGIHFRVVRGLIQAVDVHNLPGYGIHVQGIPAAENGTGSDWATYDCEISHCKVFQCGKAGIFAGGNRAEDGRIDNCTCFHNGDVAFSPIPADAHGIHLSGSSWQISNTHCYSNKGRGILIDTGNARTKLSNCKVEHNLTNIYVMGSGTQIIGCNIKGSASAGNTDGIMIDAATGTIISGCYFESTGDTSTNVVRYAVNFANNANSCVITNNIFGTNFTAAQINVAAVPSTGQQFGIMIRNNRGFFTETEGVATIANGTTSITVTHGLGNPYATVPVTLTPKLQDIKVTPTNNPTNDPGWFYISGITSTQFVINVRNQPGTSGATFAWQVHWLWR